MRFSRWLRALKPQRPNIVTKTAHRLRPNCEVLENRIVPTINLILDFDGGTIPTSPNYNIVGGSNNVNWKSFVPHANGNRTEQILQIVAGVREDYANYDVNVIWDDRGVASPYFSSL